jgi:hypothetical protein
MIILEKISGFNLNVISLHYCHKTKFKSMIKFAHRWIIMTKVELTQLSQGNIVFRLGIT